MKRILWLRLPRLPYVGSAGNKAIVITTPRLKVRKLSSWPVSVGPYRAEYIEQPAASPNDAQLRNSLLLREIEETNKWARLGCQLYFGWFTLLLTANAVATGWLFTHNGPMPWFAPFVLAVFFGLNLMGVLATSRVRRHLGDADRRIKVALDNLSYQRVDRDLKPQSAVPMETINTAFRFTGAALAMLMLFWTAMGIGLALEKLG